MRNLLNSMLCVSLILLISCHKEEQLTCCDFEISYANEHDLYSNWSLVGIINNKPFEEECAEGKGGTVQFLENGYVGGNTACNQLVGEFEKLGLNGMKVKSLGQSLRGCVGEESTYWEGKFPSELREAQRFEIEGNKLTLFTENDNRLVFIAVE